MAARHKLASDAWGSLLRVHAALVPVIDSVLRAGTGLPLSWYDVLLELSVVPEGRLRMSTLGERVVLSRTRVSRLVDDMVARGLLAREEDPEDRRSSFAVLTPAGRTEFTTAARVYVRAIEDQFAGALTNRQLEEVARLLNAVLAHQATVRASNS
jgi:DNA-binding MarR family transcriptional regulator